ncbi:MAG: ABC transporter substrate-binding protein, partial [Coprococcus sp.]
VRFNSNIEEFTYIEEMKEGDVDFITYISMDGKTQLEAAEGAVVTEKTYPNIEYFELNTTAGNVFEDIAVRQAVALSIDREALCELTDGSAAPAYSMIYDSVKNFSQEAKDDFMNNYANDPERAKQILADAGYADSDGDGYVDKDGQNVEFTFYTRSSGTSVTMAQGLQEQMKTVGIKMNIESIDWNYIYENINNDEYDAGIEVLEWAEPILVLNCCYYDQDAPGNTDEFYAAVADASSTVDSDERTAKIGAIQKDMYTNWNIIPFYSDVNYIAYNSYVKGIKVQADGSLYWNDMSF